MDCIMWLISEAPNKGYLHRCTICTRHFESPTAEPHLNHRRCPGVEVADNYRMGPMRTKQTPPPVDGPGLETQLIFTSLALPPKEQCQCDAKAAWMNQWGVQGCKERRKLVVSWLRDSQQWYGPEEQAIAAYNALKSGLAFKLDLLDLFGSIVDLAIARAEAKLPPT